MSVTHLFIVLYGYTKNVREAWTCAKATNLIELYNKTVWFQIQQVICVGCDGEGLGTSHVPNASTLAISLVNFFSVGPHMAWQIRASLTWRQGSQKRGTAISQKLGLSISFIPPSLASTLCPSLPSSPSFPRSVPLLTLSLSLPPSGSFCFLGGSTPPVEASYAARGLVNCRWQARNKETRIGNEQSLARQIQSVLFSGNRSKSQMPHIPAVKSSVSR